ncbi:MAG: shikimate kinase [Bacteroidota bacterium]|nr:shikimate kinase [Bacteroidota bacterium]
MEQRIYIIGMPGSGKSTIGKSLAKKLSWTFIDLDQMITENENMNIEQIFEQKGEAYFRGIEHKILKQTKQLNNVVISCGGGTPAFENNMDWINKNGFSIYLNASVSLLKSRILQSKTVRPLFKKLEKEKIEKKITKLFAQREKYFCQAALHIPLPLKSVKSLATQASAHFSNIYFKP